MALCLSNYIPYKFYKLFLIPFYLQAVQIHSANGVKLLRHEEECSVAHLHIIGLRPRVSVGNKTYKQ
jgi:hypothetical protein